jgi:type IV pilus assembly protein PilF
VWLNINYVKKFNRVAVYLLSIALVSCSSFLPERESDEAASIYLQLGIRYLNINNLPAAKENLEMALKTDSDNTAVHIALAFLYEKLNKFDDARAQYERASSLDPENLDLQNNYGRFLCDRREYDKGMALLTQASSNLLNQTPWMALTNAGRCQLAMGDRSKAENYFNKALQVNPNYPPLLQEMQKLSFQKSDYKAAREYLQRFLTVAEQSPVSLWIGIQTEAALGNEMLVKEYTDLLLEKFPYSNETKQIKSTPRPR